MWTDEAGAIGIGYEGETPDSLIQKLQAWNVTMLVDVRLNAISRKRGFSKTALRDALEQSGIVYVHRPELGNPKDNRDGYSERRTAAGDGARAQFKCRLANMDAQEALREVAEAARNQHVAVFCFEANGNHCHREQVLEALGALLVPTPA